ncbi:MAG TPA: hypothetical protein VN673_00610, partial [Clostridia bacterium]|nr:hypothetical protein [Clostridia bacterium]
MNFWDGQQWVPSHPSFSFTGDAFEATEVQHPVRLSSDICQQGAVLLRTPDGKLLYSTPVGIGLYDPEDGRFALIGTITNCQGSLISTNQVLYDRAFSGVCASVVYDLQRGSFAQDIVFTGKLDPADWGFSTNSRIQIITEFYQAPAPERLRRALYIERDPAVRARRVSPDLMDEVLGFGEFVLGTGRAFTTSSSERPEGAAAVVTKEFRTVEDRTFLVESVEYSAIRAGLESLPPCQLVDEGHASMSKRPRVGDSYAAVPKPPPAAQAKAIQRPTGGQLASAARMPAGVLVDYIGTIGGTLTGTIVFQSSTTYLVSGTVYCNGTTIIEGGTVFKYKKGCSLQLNSSLVCRTSAFRPAVFTAVDDDTVGDMLEGWPGAGYTGVIDPAGYANPALICSSSMTLGNLRFRYAQTAVANVGNLGGMQITINHSQFLNCVRGLSLTHSGSGSGYGSGGASLNNVLMANVQYPVAFPGPLTGVSCSFANCTFDMCLQLVTGVTPNSVNSVYANVAALGQTPSGNYNGFYNSPQFGGFRQVASSNPFQMVGAGNYYLDQVNGATFRNSGTTAGIAFLQTDLKERTTYAPVLLAQATFTTDQAFPQVPRDIDAPDLGYHYDAADYLISDLTMDNATLTLAPGFAALIYGDVGITLKDKAALVSIGTPLKHNHLSRFHTVQEQPVHLANGSVQDNIGLRPLSTGAALAVVDCQFTDFETLGGLGHHFLFDDSSSSLGSLLLRDCQFMAGRCGFGGPRNAV